MRSISGGTNTFTVLSARYVFRFLDLFNLTGGDSERTSMKPRRGEKVSWVGLDS